MTTSTSLTERVNKTWPLKRELVGWLDHTDIDILIEKEIRPKKIGNSSKAVLVATLVALAETREDVQRELRMRRV